MEISTKNSSMSSQQNQTINAAVESDSDRHHQSAELERVDARRLAEERIQQNRLKKQHLAEDQLQAQLERRLQGRLVTDARREKSQQLDEIAHSRSMQNKIEQTYVQNRQQRAAEQQQREAAQRQEQIQSHRTAAIDLVV